jgi:hypothetical protein
MAEQLVVFERVRLIQCSPFGFRCEVDGRVIWVGNLQWQPGTTVHFRGDRLVLRRTDAAELGLVDAA